MDWSFFLFTITDSYNFGNKLVQDELSKVFGETISTFSPNTYFIVLVLCFASSLLVSLLSTKNISKIDPKQGLRL